MDSTRQLFILRSRVGVRLTSVGNEAVDSKMTMFVSELPTSRSPKEIPQYGRHIVGRSLRIDAIDRSGDSEQRDLREILGSVGREAATEVREEGRTQALKQSLECPFLAAVHCADASR